MVAPTFDISERSRVTGARALRPDGERLRYRLDVLATSAADVVQSAGGWLYDRVMAGWEVTVLLAESCDTRPLRILGARGVDLASATGSTSHTLAVSAEAFTADARVRDWLLESLEGGLTEVALWGQAPEAWPLRINRATTQAQHLLSAAARTFKAQALTAAGMADATVDPTETLLCDVRAGGHEELVRLD